MSAGSAAPKPGPGSGAPLRTPKGMHDVLWPESARWEGTVARFASLVEGAGYGLTITPILEHAGVFLRGIGEGSEVVGKEMYVFEDRDGQMMALRPEGTAPIARAYVQHHPVPPWKAWYVAPSFRHENPQHGRYRQHHQLGVEALGPADADLDVEVVALAHDFFAGFGLRRVTLRAEFDGRRGLPSGIRRAPRAHSSPSGPTNCARPTGPGTWRTRCGSSIASRKSAGPLRRTPRTSSTICATRAGRTSRGSAPGSTRSASATPSTTAWCAASTTTRAPPSSSRRTRWTRRRTASAGAGDTTAWWSCSAAIRRPASGSASGWSGCCWPAMPRACTAPSPWWRRTRCTPT